MNHKAKAIQLLGKKKDKYYSPYSSSGVDLSNSAEQYGYNQMHSIAVDVVVGLLGRIDELGEELLKLGKDYTDKYAFVQINEQCLRDLKMLEYQSNEKGKELQSAKERIEELENIIKTGKCKHIAEDVISGECSLCHLAWCELRIKVLEKELQSLKGKLTVENLDMFLAEKFNHLFSPEENYLGRLLLAKAILKYLEATNDK